MMVAMTAKTVISTGISSRLRLANRRLSLSTPISMIPVRCSTMNMPPIMKVKKTTWPALIRPFGMASMKSVRPTGVDSTNRKDSASMVVRPLGPGMRS